jgi:hypothetical protein
MKHGQIMSKFKLRRLGLADDPGRFKPSLQACLEAVLEQSDALMDEVLVGLKAAQLSAKGQTAAAGRSPVWETVQLLLDQEAAIRRTFALQLRACVFGGDSSRKAAQPLVRFDDFQFLEAEQIDANIEFALTQQEVLLAVDDVLPLLNAMISSLLGWASVQAHLNPLKPESFVHALRETLTQYLPSESERSVVMPIAASKLGVGLRQLYREVAEWLRSLGVEPVATPVAAPGLRGAAPGAQPPTPLTRTMLTLDKLRRLLSGELGPGDSALASDFTNTVPASFEALQDMQMVEPMLKRLAERARNSEATDAAVAVAGAQGEQAHKKTLGLQLGEEVVHLMLENLMQDARLLAPVRSNLKLLEPVLLALSRSDPRFFSERQHPARVFLDRMTHRSLAFSSEGSPGFVRFHKTFSNAVAVLCGGSGGSASFARVLGKLEEAWAKEEEQQRLRREDAARSLLHAEQRNLLAQKLSLQFSERMANKKVPELIGAFLRGPWAQVVAQAQLKSADGSIDPGGYQDLVDDLIWSVQPRLTRRNRTRLVQMVPTILVTIRQGLLLISYPEERIAAFFNALVTFHEQAFEPLRAAAAQAEAATPESDADLWVVESEASDSGYLEDGDALALEPASDALSEDAPRWQVEDLNAGAWVDLALGGVWVRAQLNWASPHRSLFMFVSGSGLAHSLSRRTLVRLRSSGLIRLVSDGRVMDHALDAVAQAALRNNARGERE